MPAPQTPSQTERKVLPKKKTSARKKLAYGDDIDKNDVHKENELKATAPSTPKQTRAEAEDKEVATPVKVLSATKSPATKELIFGRSSCVAWTKTEPEVKAMYSIVNRCTGSLGGNGAGGAIYGELTQVSMQKVINLMVEQGELNQDSAFIDVGAGLGKPNLHVSIDPGVKLSVGIEMEKVRWTLSMSNLKHYIDQTGSIFDKREKTFENNVAFMHGDAAHAKSFDPFTHIYMFDIGFPPTLFEHIAKCVKNSTTAKYVLCYHGPRLMIDRYGFEMEFIDKQPTSMHGSKEGHTAYLYKCTHNTKKKVSKAASSCDPLFKEVVDVIINKNGSGLSAWVTNKHLEEQRTSGNTKRPTTRSQTKKK